jgi:hypothetical protein
MNCAVCNREMENGGLYVRGLGGSLFWSIEKNIPWFSRRDLNQIDLSKVSLTGTGAQAVVESWRCRCGLITFKAKYVGE